MSKNSKLCRETTHLQLVVDLLTSLGERGWSHYTHTHTPYPTPQSTSKKPYNSPVSRIARQPWQHDGKEVSDLHPSGKEVWSTLLIQNYGLKNANLLHSKHYMEIF